MRRRLRRAGLPVVGACGLLIGCGHGQESHYPPDPLLLSKKPVESRPERGPGLPVARHEPRAPESLVAALPPADPEVNTAEGPRHQSVPTMPTSFRNDDNDEP